MCGAVEPVVMSGELGELGELEIILNLGSTGYEDEVGELGAASDKCGPGFADSKLELELGEVLIWAHSSPITYTPAGSGLGEEPTVVGRFARCASRTTPA